MKIKNPTIKKILNKINWHYLVLSVFILVIFIAMSVQSKHFMTLANMEILINNFLMEAIMALGMTMVIISGGSDISISGILPFTAITFAYMMLGNVPVALAAVAAIIVGGLIGLINNELRRLLNIHPMIVTMATQLTLKGLNLAITGGSVVAGFSEDFQKIGGFKPLGLSLAIWAYIVLAVFYVLFSRNNRLFLNVYFVGGNKDAATLSGMNAERVLRFVYVASGLLAWRECCPPPYITVQVTVLARTSK